MQQLRQLRTDPTSYVSHLCRDVVEYYLATYLFQMELLTSSGSNHDFNIHTHNTDSTSEEIYTTHIASDTVSIIPNSNFDKRLDIDIEQKVMHSLSGFAKVMSNGQLRQLVVVSNDGQLHRADGVPITLLAGEYVSGLYNAEQDIVLVTVVNDRYYIKLLHPDNNITTIGTMDRRHKPIACFMVGAVWHIVLRDVTHINYYTVHMRELQHYQTVVLCDIPVHISVYRDQFIVYAVIRSGMLKFYLHTTSGELRSLWTTPHKIGLSLQTGCQINSYGIAYLSSQTQIMKCNLWY